MLREFWNRLIGRERDEAIEREAELERLSPAERTHAQEGIEGYRSDQIAGERTSGLDLGHFSDDV
jgi:hypothetical protein